MSPAVFDMYAGCSTLDEDWAVPEHDGQICTLLAAPRVDFHPPHHRAPPTPPVTGKQWTQSQVRIRTILVYSAHYTLHSQVELGILRWPIRTKHTWAQTLSKCTPDPKFYTLEYFWIRITFSSAYTQSESSDCVINLCFNRELIVRNIFKVMYILWSLILLFF